MPLIKKIILHSSKCRLNGPFKAPEVSSEQMLWMCPFHPHQSPNVHTHFRCHWRRRWRCLNTLDPTGGASSRVSTKIKTSQKHTRQSHNNVSFNSPQLCQIKLAHQQLLRRLFFTTETFENRLCTCFHLNNGEHFIFLNGGCVNLCSFRVVDGRCGDY